MNERILFSSIVITLLLFNTHGHKEFNIKDYIDETKPEETQRLKDHIAQFSTPHVVKVNENIYLAIGYALANSIMIIAPDGLIIIDTTESIDAATLILAEFRKVTSKKVRAIIYTHSHVDHVWGTEAYLQDAENRDDVEIWAHRSMINNNKFFQGMTMRANYLRSKRQFGTNLPEDVICTAGIGYRYMKGTIHDTVLPNHILETDSGSFEIAGTTLELMYIPGETDDQMGVYWPAEQAVFIGDTMYKAFPNLYSVRGVPFRDFQQWISSLDIIRSLNAEVLVPSHTREIKGSEAIFQTLTDYRDAIQYVHDQTVRYINKGWHPDDIAKKIELPTTLSQNPYLDQWYGTTAWSSKGLFSGYLGWFSGDITELNPLSPKEKSKRLLEMVGWKKLLKTAKRALKRDNDPQWALELATSVLSVYPNHEKAQTLRAMALVVIGNHHPSMVGRNYFMTAAYETLGEIEIKISEEGSKTTIRNTPMEALLGILSRQLDPQNCPGYDKIFHFEFTDLVNTTVSFHARNGIWDFSDVPLVRSPDVTVMVSSNTWVDILTQDTTFAAALQSGELQVTPIYTDLIKLLSCLEG